MGSQRDLQIAYAVGYKASTGDSSDWTEWTSDHGVARFSGAHSSSFHFTGTTVRGYRWATVLYLDPNNRTGFGLVGPVSGTLISDGR